MRMLSRIFGEKKVEMPKPRVALAVIDGNEPETIEEMIEQELYQYQWLASTHEAEANSRFQEMRSAMSLGLKNQVVLNAREVVALAFRDFSEGNGLDVHEFRLEPLTENYDTGLHRIDGALNLWMMHELDSKVVRLPREALNALGTLKPFPRLFIQNIKVLQEVERRVPFKDYRFTGEKAFHFPTILPAPCPLLVVKVSDRWFSIFQWE